MRRVNALPLAVADAAVAKLTGKEPIAELDPSTYTETFVRRYEGWTFGRLRIERDEPNMVAMIDGEVPVWSAGLALRADDDGELFASLAHAVLQHVISQRDLAAIEADVSTWARDASDEGLDPEPPPPPPGPEAFELDPRPRAWALVGSLVTLPVATSILALSVWALVRGGAGASCSAPIWLMLSSAGIFFSAARLREVLWLEPATRRLRPDRVGFFDPSTGKRVEWADVRAQVRWLTVDCTLEGGRTLRFARSAFRHPDAFAWALVLATTTGASRYR